MQYSNEMRALIEKKLELLSCEVNTFQHRWIGIPLFFMTIKSYQTVESHQHRRHVDLQTESFGAQVCFAPTLSVAASA